MKRKFTLIVGIICLCVGLSVGGIGIFDYLNGAAKQNEYDKLREEAVKPVEDKPDLPPVSAEEDPEPSKPQEPEAKPVYIPQKEIDWEALYATNADIYAWIYIPETNVDYPVLQHKTDDTFYLLHNLDGSGGRPGCIYSERVYNSKEFTDPATVLYGHNMRNQTMFGTLHAFENEEFFNAERMIYIYTPDYDYAYEVIAGVEIDDRHLLAGQDLSAPGALPFFYETILKDGSGLKKQSEIENEDRLLVLSTCVSGDRSTYRYLVMGRLLNPRLGEL